MQIFQQQSFGLNNGFNPATLVRFGHDDHSHKGHAHEGDDECCGGGCHTEAAPADVFQGTGDCCSTEAPASLTPPELADPQPRPRNIITRILSWVKSLLTSLVKSLLGRNS